MENKHLIAKQVFELRVGVNEGAVPQLQDSFSRYYWQSVVPAFERLFDRLVAPDEIVRVDRLELDVGRWSVEEILSGRFIESLMAHLESEISSTLQGGETEAGVQPLRAGRFDLWLHFLEHGSLPADAARPESREEWHRQVFECLASESGAVQRLRNLVSRRPVVLERLILQYDEAFLQQILELLTSRKQDDLLRLVNDVVGVVVRAITDLSDRIRAVGERTPTKVGSIAEVLRESASLRSLAGEPAPTLPKRDLLRRIELVVWRILFDEVIVKGRRSNTATLIARVIRSDALLPWQGILIRALGAKKDEEKEDDVWTRVAEAIEALPPPAQEFPAGPGDSIEADAAREALLAGAAENLRIPGAEEGDLFYVQAAGVILFHPFLHRFFQKLGLFEEGAFIDEASRQRAVCLLHHLATGEVRTPEYQLVLPKFLCGMPLNAPLDHFIEIDAAERFESENLIRAAIDHWGALGSCSPDGLREGFLQRDGKLEKRETGWHLVVERKTQDILLDRLPQGWGLGMVKLPWMDELLHVDW